MRVGIVGNGWRAVTWRKIVRQLSDQFELVGTVIRDPQKRAEFSESDPSPVFSDFDALASAGIDLAIISVSWQSQPELIREAAARGIRVLSETPPAPTTEALQALIRAVPPDAVVQIAEQYPYHPLSAAQIAMVDAGLIGDVQSAYVSIAHGYHGVALIRRFLRVGIEDVVVRAQSFPVRTTAGPGRNLDYAGPTIEDGHQVLATLRFGDKTGVFDFLGSSYFAHIRHRRATIRGLIGEIEHDTVRTVADQQSPLTYPILRREAGINGNLEGSGLLAITAGERYWYRNPFVNAGFSDDEIAMADTLVRTAALPRGEPGFYGLREASFDHAVGIAIDTSARTEETVSIAGADGDGSA